MLQRKENIDNEGVLGIWHIAESQEELINLLPPNQQNQARQYVSELKSERRILEWLATRTLLFALVGEEKTIANNRDGKPFLLDGSYQISISHTKNLVAILLHKQRVVGIDVETIAERVNKISERFVSENEFIDVSQQTVHRLLHWSAKEVMFKMMEENEINFKEQLFISPFTPQEKGIVQAQELRTDSRQIFRIHYEVHSHFVLTWSIGE